MKFILIILILTCINAIGQNLKTKKKSSTYYKEIFSFDKKTKQKQGLYFKIRKSNKDTLIKGFFKDDKKVGIWKFFDKDNTLYFAYDYNQNITTLEDSFKSTDSVHVKTNNEFKLTKVDNPALYIGFKDEVKTIIKETFNPPTSLFQKEESGFTIASFEINKTGEIQNISIESSNNINIEKAIKKSIQKIKNKWIPASINSKPVVSKIYAIYNISLTRNSNYQPQKTFIEKPNVIVLNFNYLGVSRQKN